MPDEGDGVKEGCSDRLCNCFKSLLAVCSVLHALFC